MLWVRGAGKLRGNLGESLASVQKFDKPLQEVTTSSLEALKAFTQADELREKGDALPPVALYQRAIELDPNFAMAYARVGNQYLTVGQLDLARQNFQKSFELRERASEREKFYITEKYYDGTGQFEQAIQAMELYAQTYPSDQTPRVNLAVAYQLLGDFDKGLTNSLEAIRLEPDSWYGYVNAAYCYTALGRFDEAKAGSAQVCKRPMAGSFCMPVCTTLRWFRATRRRRTAKKFSSRTRPRSSRNGF